MRIVPRISLPLLAKELVEKANAKRTYIIRTLCAVVIAGVFAFNMLNYGTGNYRGGMSLWAMAMAGKTLTFTILSMITALVLLILPSAAATSITSEKERGTLELLLLTRLGPWKIVLQKFLGNVIPMFMLLFLALPMLAIAHTLGGVDLEHWNEVTIWLAELPVMILFAAAWGVAMSAFFRSGAAAAVAMYIFCGIAFWILIALADMPRLAWRGPGAFADLTALGVAQLLLVLPALILATVFLRRRHTPAKGNLALRIFLALDRFWKHLNDKWLGGMEIVAGGDVPLPEDDPVGWFEKYKKPSGSKSHLTRIIMFFTIPAVIVVIGVFTIDPYYQLNTGSRLGLMLLAHLYLGVAALTLLVKGVSIVAEERRNQTLDVLLTTQVSAAGFLAAKKKYLRRLHVALVMPPLILVVLALVCPGINVSKRITIALPTIVLATIHLTVLSEISIWIGVKARNHRRALMTALAVVLVWILAPLLMGALVDGISRNTELADTISYISPLRASVRMFSRRMPHLGSFAQIITCAVIPAMAIYTFCRIDTWRNAEKRLRQ